MSYFLVYLLGNIFYSRENKDNFLTTFFDVFYQRFISISVGYFAVLCMCCIACNAKLCFCKSSYDAVNLVPRFLFFFLLFKFLKLFIFRFVGLSVSLRNHSFSIANGAKLCFASV